MYQRKQILFIIAVFILLCGSFLFAGDMRIDKFCSVIDLGDTSKYPMRQFSEFTHNGNEASPKKNGEYSSTVVIGSVKIPGDKKRGNGFFSVNFDLSELPFVSDSHSSSRRDIRVMLVAHSQFGKNWEKDFPRSQFNGKFFQEQGIFNNKYNFIMIDSKNAPSNLEIKFSSKAKSIKHPDYWVDIVLMLPPIPAGTELAVVDDYTSVIKVSLDGGPQKKFEMQGTYKKSADKYSRIHLDVDPVSAHRINLRNLNPSTPRHVADISLFGEFHENGYYVSSPDLDLHIGSQPWSDQFGTYPFMMYRAQDLVYTPENSFFYTVTLKRNRGKQFSIMKGPSASGSSSSHYNQASFDGTDNRFIRLKNKKTYNHMTQESEFIYDNKFSLFMNIDDVTYQRIHDQNEPMKPGVYMSDIYISLISNR